MAWTLIREIDENTAEYRAATGKVAVLYRPENNLGKRALGFAARPEGSHTITKADAAELGSLGGKAKYAKHKEKVANAFAQSLHTTHPDSEREEDGLLMLAEATFIQANDPEGGGAAVKAREQFIQEYTGGKQASTVVDARQVHITVSPEVAGRLGSLAELLSGVDEDDE